MSATADAPEDTGLVTLDEAIAMSRVSPNSFRRHVLPKLEAVHLGRRVFFDRAQLIAVIKGEAPEEE